MTTIYVIGDTQSKEGVRNPLIPVAHHIAELKPNYLVHLGDHWDFPSLSQYDKGKKSHRARTYSKDVMAGNTAMEEFWAILDKQWPQHKKKCKKIILLGNHEERRNRAMDYGPDELVDLMEFIAPDYSGWDEVHDFLKIRRIKGVNFSHYFQNLNSGKAIGTARQILMKKHASCIAGHMQGFDYAEMMTDVGMIQAIILGSTYYHKEAYKAQSNHHYRGTVMLTNVSGGQFDFNRYSLKSLTKKYL